jgi:hypothetical protein
MEQTPLTETPIEKINPKDLLSNPAVVSLLLISGAACYLLIYRFFKIREDKRRNG